MALPLQQHWLGAPATAPNAAADHLPTARGGVAVTGFRIPSRQTYSKCVSPHAPRKPLYFLLAGDNASRQNNRARSFRPSLLLLLLLPLVLLLLLQLVSTMQRVTGLHEAEKLGEGLPQVAAGHAADQKLSTRRNVLLASLLGTAEERRQPHGPVGNLQLREEVRRRRPPQRQQPSQKHEPQQSQQQRRKSQRQPQQLHSQQELARYKHWLLLQQQRFSPLPRFNERWTIPAKEDSDDYESHIQSAANRFLQVSTSSSPTDTVASSLRIPEENAARFRAYTKVSFVDSASQDAPVIAATPTPVASGPLPAAAAVVVPTAVPAAVPTQQQVAEAAAQQQQALANAVQQQTMAAANQQQQAAAAAAAEQQREAVLAAVLPKMEQETAAELAKASQTLGVPPVAAALTPSMAANAAAQAGQPLTSGQVLAMEAAAEAQAAERLREAAAAAAAVGAAAQAAQLQKSTSAARAEGSARMAVFPCLDISHSAVTRIILLLLLPMSLS